MKPNLFISIALLLLISCFKQAEKSVEKKRDMINLHISGDTLLYTDIQKKIVVEDLATDKIIFSKQIEDEFNYVPILVKNHIFFSMSDSLFVCWDIHNNIPVWDLQTEAKVKNVLYVNDSFLIINLKNGGFQTINSKSGKIIYSLPYVYGEDCPSPDLSPYPIASDEKSFYVSNWQCNTVTSFDIKHGKVNWKMNLQNGISDLVLVDDKIFVGINNYYENGEIALLDANTGNVLFEEKSFYEERMKPIVYKNKIYYYTYDYKLYEFDLTNKKTKLVLDFGEAEDISGYQMHLLGSTLYLQNNTTNISIIDLDTYKIHKTPRSIDRQFLGIYKNKKNQVKFLY